MKEYIQSPAIKVLANWWKQYSNLGVHHRQSSRMASAVKAVNRSSILLLMIFVIAGVNALFYLNYKAILVFSSAAVLCTIPIYLNSKERILEARLAFHILLLLIFSILGILLPKAYWHFGNLYTAIAALFIFRSQLKGWFFCVLAIVLFILVEFNSPLIDPIVPIIAKGFYNLLSGMTINLLFVMLVYHYYTMDDSGHIWWRANDGLFEAIIEGALDAVVTIDEQGRLVGWNKQAESVFKYTKAEALGKPMHELIIPHHLRTAHIEGMKRYLETGVGPILNHRFEIEALDKSGRKFPVELAITPLPADGEVLFNAFLRDITEIKQNRESLLEANKELRDFTSIVSHDLQEPLRTMSGFCEILSEELTNESDEVKEYLKIISGSSKRMTQMLKDMLDYARSGKNTSPSEDVDLNEVLNHVHQNLSRKLNENKASLKWEKLPSVAGHSTSFIQIFQNLVANGIKFRKKEVLPQVKIDAKRSDEGQWIIGIHDNGIGMEEKFYERIFEPFIRLHSADEYEGSGIGLAVCKKIVEHYGGRIWVESEVGKGTTFWLALPEA